MRARDIMNQFNHNALSGTEGNVEEFLEDVKDPDGRWYRVEYRCRADGSDATAWLRYNPWGDQGALDYLQSHLSDDGFVCLGAESSRENSPYNLAFAVARARFWCTGYSYLRERGYAAACAAMRAVITAA